MLEFTVRQSSHEATDIVGNWEGTRFSQLSGTRAMKRGPIR